MWAEKSVFYHIYPLGFCGAPMTNSQEGEVSLRLNQIYDWIPHLKSLGINAVYFGPVFESVAHGYDTTDYFRVDKRLGDNEDFKRLVNFLHQNGIKVVLDGVFNHVGRKFWAFEDVKQHKSDSKYCSWFRLDFSHDNRYGDGFCYEGWDGCDDLVKLNLANPEVRAYLLSAVAMWQDAFGVDGLRLDVAHYLNHGFLRELKQMCLARNPEFWLMGETVFGDYRRLVNQQMLDSCTNYELYKALYSSCNDNNMFELAHALRRQFEAGKGIYEGLKLYSFLDNHDVSRIATVLKNPRQLKALYGLLFTLPGIPSVYYGSEWGITGDRRKSDSEVRPQLILQEENDLSRHIAWWTEFRKKSDILSYGGYQELAVNSTLLVYRRNLGENKLDFAVNIGEGEQKIELEGKEYMISGYDIKLITV